MKKRTLIAILGILVAILPVLGFPMSWKKIMFMAFGLLITYLALSGRKAAVLAGLNHDAPASSSLSSSAPAASLAYQPVRMAEPANQKRSTLSADALGHDRQVSEDAEAALVAELAALPPKPKRQKKQSLRTALGGGHSLADSEGQGQPTVSSHLNSHASNDGAEVNG